MATVHVAFFAPVSIGGTSIYARTPRASQTITSSGSSQQTTITAKRGETASITSSGGAVFILAGSNPTAASGSGYLVTDGATFEIGFMAEGDEIALIDA